MEGYARPVLSGLVMIGFLLHAGAGRSPIAAHHVRGQLLLRNSCTVDHLSPFVDIRLQPVEDFFGRAGLGLDAELERAFLSSGISSTSRRPALSVLITSGGAGAKIAFHDRASNSPPPASFTVGTSGMKVVRTDPDDDTAATA